MKEKKPKPLTKEQLVKINEEHVRRIDFLKYEDERTRAVLSELLGSYEFQVERWSQKTEKNVKVQSWLGIAFLIGELKADADYAMCIEARETLRKENDNLRRKIDELQNPPKKPE